MDARVSKSVEKFFSTFSRLKYKKGDIIIRAEDTPQGALYLKKGYIRQYAIDDSGAALMLHIFKPGSFFPMTWIINNTPNVYYFEAVTPVEVWRAPKSALQDFLQKNPEVMYDFASRLLYGLTGLMKRMEYLVLDDALSKTKLLLIYMAQTLGTKEGDKIVLPVPLTHREIASWIGTTRETASIQVEILKKMKLIAYRKRQLIIPNVKALKNDNKQS